MNDTLRISVDRDGGATVISCRGEIDLSNVAELVEAIGWSMTGDLRVLRIDLAGVGFIDSSVLRCLVDTARQCHRQGARLEVVSSESVARTLQLVGLPADAGEPFAVEYPPPVRGGVVLTGDVEASPA
jgi:anti-anti-sigma factor